VHVCSDDGGCRITTGECDAFECDVDVCCGRCVALKALVKLALTMSILIVLTLLHLSLCKIRVHTNEAVDNLDQARVEQRRLLEEHLTRRRTQVAAKSSNAAATAAPTKRPSLVAVSVTGKSATAATPLDQHIESAKATKQMLDEVSSKLNGCVACGIVCTQRPHHSLDSHVEPRAGGTLHGDLLTHLNSARETLDRIHRETKNSGVSCI
jgi:hypothetical protein